MLKHKIHNLVEKGAHGSKVYLAFDYTIMILILLNVIAIILETIPAILEPFELYFRIFEIFSIIVFSLEYMMRIYVSDLTHPSGSRLKSAFKFIFSAYGLIDLAAILPFFLPYLVNIDLRFLRILRLMRFFRILKLNRYNNSLNLIWMVMKEKKEELTITVTLTVLILIVASILMFYIEGDIQPDKFPNILACLWWAVATLTTVGYGDVYPVTGLGKVVGGFIAILGIGLVALPTGLISAGFMEKVGKKHYEHHSCPHCGKEL
jgi:voltage-gated potassium channel